MSFASFDLCRSFWEASWVIEEKQRKALWANWSYASTTYLSILPFSPSFLPFHPLKSNQKIQKSRRFYTSPLFPSEIPPSYLFLGPIQNPILSPWCFPFYFTKPQTSHFFTRQLYGQIQIISLNIKHKYHWNSDLSWPVWRWWQSFWGWRVRRLFGWSCSWSRAREAVCAVRLRTNHWRSIDWPGPDCSRDLHSPHIWSNWPMNISLFFPWSPPSAASLRATGILASLKAGAPCSLFRSIWTHSQCHTVSWFWSLWVLSHLYGWEPWQLPQEWLALWRRWRAWGTWLQGFLAIFLSWKWGKSSQSCIMRR